MFILSNVIFTPVFSSALWIEGLKRKELDWHEPFQNPSLSSAKKEKGGSSAQRKAKTPFWSLLCCQGNTLLCQSQKSTARMKGKAVLWDGGAQCFCTEQKKKRKDSRSGTLSPLSNFSAMMTRSHAPPCEHRKSSLEMGPGSAKVLNLFSHWREM